MVFFTRASCAAKNCKTASLLGSEWTVSLTASAFFSFISAVEFEGDSVGFSAVEESKFCKNWNNPNGSMQKASKKIKFHGKNKKRSAFLFDLIVNLIYNRVCDILSLHADEYKIHFVRREEKRRGNGTLTLRR